MSNSFRHDTSTRASWPLQHPRLLVAAIACLTALLFASDSFAPNPGWQRVLQQTGSGESAVITKITWTGGKVPTGEDALFQFLAQASSSGTYTFQVQQTYSDGSIVDWAGPESAPTIEAKS